MRWLTKFMHRRDLDGAGSDDGREDNHDTFSGWLGRGRRDGDGLKPHPSSRWPSGDIVAECEAFLTGNYRQLLVRSNRAVPGWAWINELAHGTMDDVRSMARFAGESSHGAGTGSTKGPKKTRNEGDEAVGAFLGRLARQVLVKMRQEHAQLDEVQRDLLIPLELALAAQARRVPAAAADDLSREVSQRLVSGLEPIDVGARSAADDGDGRRRNRGDDGADHDGSDPGRRGEPA